MSYRAEVCEPCVQFLLGFKAKGILKAVLLCVSESLFVYHARSQWLASFKPGILEQCNAMEGRPPRVSVVLKSYSLEVTFLSDYQKGPASTNR